LLIEEAEALAGRGDRRLQPRIEALILGVGDLSASQGMRAGHIAGRPATRRRGHYARNA
jgi:citrate lyase subunit beta/citryl-CoA lyase